MGKTKEGFEEFMQAIDRTAEEFGVTRLEVMLAMYDPYELADQGSCEAELMDEIARLMETEPQVLADYYGEAFC